MPRTAGPLRRVASAIGLVLLASCVRRETGIGPTSDEVAVPTRGRPADEPLPRRFFRIANSTRPFTLHQLEDSLWIESDGHVFTVDGTTLHELPEHEPHRGEVLGVRGKGSDAWLLLLNDLQEPRPSCSVRHWDGHAFVTLGEGSCEVAAGRWLLGRRTHRELERPDHDDREGCISQATEPALASAGSGMTGWREPTRRELGSILVSGARMLARDSGCPGVEAYRFQAGSLEGTPVRLRTGRPSRTFLVDYDARTDLELLLVDDDHEHTSLYRARRGAWERVRLPAQLERPLGVTLGPTGIGWVAGAGTHGGPCLLRHEADGQWTDLAVPHRMSALSDVAVSDGIVWITGRVGSGFDSLAGLPPDDGLAPYDPVQFELLASKPPSAAVEVLGR